MHGGLADPVFGADCRNRQIIPVSQAYGDCNIQKTDRHIAEIAAAGVGINDHKGSKGNQHDNVAYKQEDPVFPACFFV